MLRRPRLFVRPAQVSPGVPDISRRRGLSNMFRYSAQMLISFIAYIFHFYPYVRLVGNFAGLPPRRVPSAIVHWNQNEAGHQTIKARSMLCWGAAGPWQDSLAFMPQDWWNWLIKWMKPLSVGRYQNKKKWMEIFCILVSNFTVFQPRIYTHSSSVGITWSQVVL